MYRKTWMEIDLDALEYNIRMAKEISGKELIAVVKADGYGMGDLEVVNSALCCGASMMAVSSCDEALILRNKGYEGELLILGHTDPDELPMLAEKGVAVPAYSSSWVSGALQQNCSGLKVHMKVDTGMNRIGFHDSNELNQAIQALKQHGCEVEGIFTHFACADTDESMTARQLERFKTLCESTGHTFRWIHCDNSEATLTLRESFSNACRFGIGMYGITASNEVKLKSPVSMYSTLVYVKQLPAGETIGYGATYETTESEWIGTIPVGYADGLIRMNQGRHLYIDGEYVPIVGRVCMDQTMVRLPRQMKEGSVVELFGSHLPIETMAEELVTIPYEIFCLISERVTRIYTRSGVPVSERNMRMEDSTL